MCEWHDSGNFFFFAGEFFIYIKYKNKNEIDLDLAYTHLHIFIIKFIIMILFIHTQHTRQNQKVTSSNPQVWKLLLLWSEQSKKYFYTKQVYICVVDEKLRKVHSEMFLKQFCSLFTIELYWEIKIILIWYAEETGKCIVQVLLTHVSL